MEKIGVGRQSSRWTEVVKKKDNSIKLRVHNEATMFWDITPHFTMNYANQNKSNQTRYGRSTIRNGSMSSVRLAMRVSKKGYVKTDVYFHFETNW